MTKCTTEGRKRAIIVNAKNTAFTEENIDRVFEQHYINIDQMILLREAFNLWEEVICKLKGERKNDKNE